MSESIWKRSYTIDLLNRGCRGTLMESLGITFRRTGHDFLEASMPVGPQTVQIHGVLHGGASVALAETVASMAGHLASDEGQTVVGIEINANHLRRVDRGSIIARATPIRLGRSIQVWRIEMHDDAERLVCVSRATLAVIDSTSSNEGGP